MLSIITNSRPIFCLLELLMTDIKEGTSFAAVSRIYEFDRKLRNLLFSTIEEIEIYLRTQFAYYHAHKYGPLGYLNPDNFNQNHKHENFLMLVDDAINKHRFSEDWEDTLQNISIAIHETNPNLSPLKYSDYKFE